MSTCDSCATCRPRHAPTPRYPWPLIVLAVRYGPRLAGCLYRGAHAHRAVSSTARTRNDQRSRTQGTLGVGQPLLATFDWKIEYPFAPTRIDQKIRARYRSIRIPCDTHLWFRLRAPTSPWELVHKAVQQTAEFGVRPIGSPPEWTINPKDRSESKRSEF